MAQDGEDVIGVATLCLPWCASRVFFDVFQVARRSYRYSLTLQGWQLQEPSLALKTVRDWLRMRLCDGDTVYSRTSYTGGMQATRRLCVFDSLDRGRAPPTRVVQHLFTMLGNCSVGLS